MRLRDEIESPFWLYVKGALFSVLGLLASFLLLRENPTLLSAALLAIAIWAFCRLYYFVFYVIEKYADPTFRFAGLGSLLKYWWRIKRGA
jgi:hypothetical protein